MIPRMTTEYAIQWRTLDGPLQIMVIPQQDGVGLSEARRLFNGMRAGHERSPIYAEARILHRKIPAWNTLDEFS